MRCSFWIVLFVLFTKFNGFSQEKYVKHVVAKGETISKIAQKYNIKPAAIYDLNPDAKNGIKFKEILLVPNTIDKKTTSITSSTVSKQKEHLVMAQETLYGIAKQYGVKVADLYAINPSLEKKGLRVGNNINVPISESNDLIEVNIEQKQIFKTEIKEVLPKETLYGIAKEYGVSVADIEKLNLELVNQTLKIGQKIVIPTPNSKLINQIKLADNKQEESNISSKSKTTTTVVNEVKTADDNQVVSHEVLAKETKYGIAKEYGITVKELEDQNPSIVNKLLIGEKLTIRTSEVNDKRPSKNYFSDAVLNNNAAENYKTNSFHGNDFLDQLVSTASENIGVRYRTGGTSKEGFDCSGLMCSTFSAFDIQLPRTSFEQSQFGEKINNEEAQKGDLIFFKTNGRSRINHVGMVVEVADGDIKFIHASVGGGVIISSIKEKYYSKRVTQINRVF